MSFEEFQDGRHGGHLGYQNGTILAILNLYVTWMPNIKFQLNLTYGFGGDVVWRISIWPRWRPSWISERNDFSNSESLCCHNASRQVSAQSNLWFWRSCRKCEKLMNDDNRQATDNRPWHKLTWSTAPGELIRVKKEDSRCFSLSTYWHNEGVKIKGPHNEAPYSHELSSPSSRIWWWC